MGREQPRTDRCRIVVVTGKGGVGKSTVAAALARALARNGRDAIAAELSGQARLPALLGHPSPGRPGDETEVAPGLWTTTIDPERALAEWAGQIVRPRALLDVAVRSRAFSGFVAAAPGAAELVSVTKAVELSSEDRWVSTAPRHDVTVLDAPASGHGVGLLRSPGTYAEIARVGPIASQARSVEATLRDPEECLVVAVTSPEETPVNETLELESALERSLGRATSLTVVNGVLEDALSDRETREARDAAPPSAALAAAERQRSRASRESAQLRRLREGTGAPLVELPDLGPAGATADGVELLADRLADWLEEG